MTNKRWIVAEYPRNDPQDVEQIGIYTVKEKAQEIAKNWSINRRGTEWIVVIFEAEIVETMQ